MTIEQEIIALLNQIPAAIEKAFMEVMVLRHPGHANQKTHGNRFGAGQAKESLRRLKDDKGEREKYKARARQKLGKEAKPERKPGKMNPKVKPKPKRVPKAKTDSAAAAKVKRALGEKLHVSNPDSAFTKQAIEDLALVPEGTLLAMSYRGVEVHIGDKPLTELDSNGPLKGVQPRGWPPGSKWEEVGGVYRSECKCLTVAGRGKSGSISTTLHEFGHAMHMNGSLTPKQQERLTDIHKKIYKKLPNYLQQGGPGGKAGIEETWAEGFAHVIKDPKTAKGLYSQEFIDLVKEVV